MTPMTQSNTTLSALRALQCQVEALLKEHGAAKAPTSGKPPHALLDTLIHDFRIKNDSQLADILKRQRTEISKIRHGLTPTKGMILDVHETFDISVARIRQLIAEQA